VDETNILAAVLGSRKAWETVHQIGVGPSELSEVGRAVYDAASVQYDRDKSLSVVSTELLRAQAERKFGKGSMADSVMDYVGRLPSDISRINVIEEHRLLRLGHVSATLASLLASGNHGEDTDEAIERYKVLVAGEESEEESDRLDIDDFDEEQGERIRLYPKEISDFIGGGVRRGNNVVIFGRPNSCKTMLALNNAACLAKNGYKVLYVANEEPPRDLTQRLLSRMSKIDIDEIDADPQARQAAFDRAGRAYKQNWFLLHKAGVTARDIRQAAARIRPDVIIVDQIKNVHVAEDNRALQLDKLARQVREMGIEYDAVTISVTQAGESAEGRIILGQTDVEWSNTGIPGAADLMIGIGVNDELDGLNKRMLTICKNKIKNRHGSFPVWVDSQRTLVSGRAL
jgi:KaiC/GvpD/RAD55 family RecA-like ATPase